MPKRQTNISAVNATTTVNGKTSGRPQEAVVKDVPLRMIYPNDLNPRLLIPPDIIKRYPKPIEALQEMIERARKQRHFDRLTDLLTNSADAEDDTDTDGDMDLPPLVRRLRELTRLAYSFNDDGQINPVTVVEVEANRRYVIETGERRYWAAQIRAHHLHLDEGVSTLRCIVIPADKASVFRIAKENLSREPLNAVGTAKQIALLLLHLHGENLSGGLTDALIRKAADLNLYGKSREEVEAFYEALNDMNRSTMAKYKKILELSSSAMALADNFDVELSKLYLVVTRLGEADHLEAVRHITDKGGMTLAEVEEYLQQPQDEIQHVDSDEETEEAKQKQRKARREIRDRKSVV